MADQIKFRITPEQIEAASSKLAEAGLSISGNSGSVEREGYRIGYSLSDGVLILEVHAKQRIVPMRVVRSRVRAALSGERLVELR